MSSEYRLAPVMAARLVGAALVGSAALVMVVTLLVALFDWSTWVVIGTAVLALGVTLGLAVATRLIPVLRVDGAGYRVRWVRGAGTKAAAWGEVEDAVAASPGAIDCVVLRLRDGRTTSLPVEAFAEDRDRFVTQIREHLTRGEGRRPV